MTSYASLAQQNYAPNGEIFTPRGDLRILILFATFENDSNQFFNNWPSNHTLPSYVNHDRLNDGFYHTFDEFGKGNHSKYNLSESYAQMSNPKKPFRIVASVYPKPIVLKKPMYPLNSWGGCNRQVIETFRNQDSTFDWSPYDLRTNNPNFMFDNSVSPPDHKPEFIIIIYRYDFNWKIEPYKGMKRWIGSNGGASTLSIGPIKFGDYTITSDGFHLNSNTATNIEAFTGMFKHELGHELFSGPHYMGANGTFGKYFQTQTVGWGSTVKGSMSNTFNAWERWLMGWIEIKHDVKNEKDNGKYQLKDFVTTGEALRIKVPGTEDEYIWVENHQKISVFDENPWKGNLIDHPKGSSGMGEMDPGIYMYTEKILDDRSKITTNLVYDLSKVNGVRVYNPQGNYDYKIANDITQTKDWSVYWNNKLYHFKRMEANPYGGTNPFMEYRTDYNHDGKIDHHTDFNHGRGEQAHMVMEIEDDSTYLFYANHGSRNEEAKKYRRSLAYLQNDELSLSSNPPLTNYPRYVLSKDSIAPQFFTPLKISIGKSKNHVTTVRVIYNYHTINKDIRLSGNIGIRNDGIKYTLNKKKRITINRSGTVNCTTKKEWDFIRPTKFILYDSSKFQADKKSQIAVLDSSEFIVKKAAYFQVRKKASLIIKGYSTVMFEQGALVFFHAKSTITINPSAQLIFKKGSIINGEKVLEDINIHSQEHITWKQLKQLTQIIP